MISYGDGAPSGRRDEGVAAPSECDFGSQRPLLHADVRRGRSFGFAQDRLQHVRHGEWSRRDASDIDESSREVDMSGSG